jgi:hypothetical protein
LPKIGGRLADRRGAGGRQAGEAKTFVGFPYPIGGGAKEIGLPLALGRGERGLGRAFLPAEDGQIDALCYRLGSYPQVDVSVSIGDDNAARDDDAEALGKPGKRCHLRQRQHAPHLAAGAQLQAGKLRIGLNEPILSIDAAADRAQRGLAFAHAAISARASR